MEEHILQEEQVTINRNAQRALLFIGERLAFVLFFVFVLVLVVSGYATQAFSKQEDSFIEQGTTWYKNDIDLPVQTPTDTLVTYEVSVAAVTPTPTPTPTKQLVSASQGDIGVWEKLADCETHGNWSSDTGNGYYGGLQFNMSAWQSTGGQGSPAAASKDEQIQRGKILQERRGWSPWSGCSKKLGLL